MWPSTYMQFSKLPKYWMASFIVSVSDGVLVKDDIEYLDLVDATAMTQMIMRTHGGDYWPREMLDKAAPLVRSLVVSSFVSGEEWRGRCRACQWVIRWP